MSSGGFCHYCKQYACICEAKPQHGGKREGAGRKPKDYVRLHIQVTEEQAEWLKQKDNSSATIRKLIQQAMKKETKPLPSMSRARGSCFA